VAGLAVAGVGWAVAANSPMVSQRGYALAETMGRLVLDPVEHGAIVVVRSDDVAGPSLWLSVVRNHRPDVAVVRSSHLGEPWYTRALAAKYPDLAVPDYDSARRHAPERPWDQVGPAAFANANASTSRPVYFEAAPPSELLRPDLTLVPAGPMMRVSRRGEEKVEARFWAGPISAEEVVSLCRRERGQRVYFAPGAIRVEPEAYERRLLRILLKSRQNLADWHGRSSHPERLRRAVELYESLLPFDPGYAEDVSVAIPLGVCYLRLKEPQKASRWLSPAVVRDLEPPLRAMALVALYEAYRDSGRTSEAEQTRLRALAIPGLAQDLRRRLEEGESHEK
jgi:hypothetical protein